MDTIFHYNQNRVEILINTLDSVNLLASDNESVSAYIADCESRVDPQ